MTAYVIVGFTVKDQEKLQQYGAVVPPILAKYSGEYLVKGPIEILHGENEYETQVIITFPSKEKATEWYYSIEYQALIEIRDEAMDSKFQLIG